MRLVDLRYKYEPLALPLWLELNWLGVNCDTFTHLSAQDEKQLNAILHNLHKVIISADETSGVFSSDEGCLELARLLHFVGILFVHLIFPHENVEAISAVFNIL